MRATDHNHLVETLPGLPRVQIAREVRSLADRLFNHADDQTRLDRSAKLFEEAKLTDYYFGRSALSCQPSDVFDHLRWGGQFVFVGHDARQTQELHEKYAHRREFIVETPPTLVTKPRWGIPFNPLRRKLHYFVARKVMLTRLDMDTDRYSYDVRLVPEPGDPTQYVVQKQVPTFDDAVRRLKLRFPDSDQPTIERGARKLTEKVFPVFLTREAAILKILQRDLPEAYRCRFPRVLHLEKDERGLVKRMHLNWLRLGGRMISQLEFARQSAELLHILHEKVHVIHLDLRLDNFVITENGVGFVDFGSAVRVGEDFTNSDMLTSLFSEMLSTSQIQRDLHLLLQKGTVTSDLFSNSYQKIDKAVDLFYLVLQMNNPLVNPDFRGLVHYDQHTSEARQISKLSRAVLRPEDPKRPSYRCAKDVLAGINQMPVPVGA